MILLGILGAACFYRATRLLFRWLKPDALATPLWITSALAATLTFMGMGYIIFATVEVRAYGLLLFLAPLSLWLTLRWLQHPTSWKRTILVSLSITALFSSSFTTAVFIAYLSLFVLVMQPKVIIRWAGVGVLTLLLCLPVLPKFLNSAAGRLDMMPTPVGPILDELVPVYQRFMGNAPYLLVLIGAGILLSIWGHRLRHPWRLAILLVAFLSFPLISYLVLGEREFLMIRYLWPVAVGMPLLMGAAVLVAPRLLRVGLLMLLIVMPLVPVRFQSYRPGVADASPVRTMLSWLTQNIRPGDVIIRDPECVCGSSMYWDYFVPQYFPEGYLPFVDEPGEHPRVWYLKTEGWGNDTALEARILQGRKPSVFVGPWNFLLRLYEGPPHWQGANFGDQITLNGFEIEDNRATFAESDTMDVKLWWSALTPMQQDYSISLALIAPDGRIVTQQDGPAQAPETPPSMTQWVPGAYYEDFRTLSIPNPLDTGMYTLVVTVYDWNTGERLLLADNPYFRRMGGQYALLRWVEILSY
jgi:hypothetical protein